MITYETSLIKDLFKKKEFIDSYIQYKRSNNSHRELIKFLDRIDVNHNYFKTGINVKNKKYKKPLDNDSEMIKEINSSMNKISEMNKEKISNEILAIYNKNNHLLPLIIDTIFQKTLCHHNYIPCYVFLLQKIGNKRNLMMSSLQKIKSELDMFQIDTDKSQYDKLCQENKFTDKLIGYSMLITELEERGIVHNQINESIQNIFTLIKNIKDEKDIYRSLSCLEIIFKRFYKDDDIPKKYLTILEELKLNTTSMKIKFKIMDIID